MDLANYINELAFDNAEIKFYGDNIPSLEEQENLVKLYLIHYYETVREKDDVTLEDFLKEKLPKMF